MEIIQITCLRYQMKILRMNNGRKEKKGVSEVKCFESDHIEAKCMRLAKIEAKQPGKEIITRLEKERLQIIEQERFENKFS